MDDPVSGTQSGFENLLKDVYHVRFLDFIMTYQDMAYKEGELPKCSQIPKENMPEILTNFGKYGLIDVTGKPPGREIISNGNSELFKRLYSTWYQIVVSDSDRVF